MPKTLFVREMNNVAKNAPPVQSQSNIFRSLCMVYGTCSMVSKTTAKITIHEVTSFLLRILVPLTGKWFNFLINSCFLWKISFISNYDSFCSIITSNILYFDRWWYFNLDKLLSLSPAELINVRLFEGQRVWKRQF